MHNLSNFCELKFKPCYYSNKLIEVITLLNEKHDNTVNFNQIKKAISYAKKYHANQKRQTGEPYYSHPLKVAEMVANFYLETNAIVAAILHDVIEDTNANLQDISSIFGSRIGEIVKRLTRFKLPNSDYKISSEELIMQAYLIEDATVILIKLMDRLHNLQTIQVKSKEKQHKYYLEVLNTFYLLSFKLDRKIAIRFENYLNRSIPKQEDLIFSYGIYQLESPTFQNNF